MQEGIIKTFSSPSLSAASFARRTWPEWGGLKVPPKTPIFILIAPYLMLTFVFMSFAVPTKRRAAHTTLKIVPAMPKLRPSGSDMVEVVL